MGNRRSESSRTSALMRAIVAALALSAAACAGGDPARERQAAPGYQRLPIR